MAKDLNTVILRRGDEGEFVTYWQKFLLRLGYALGNPDGIFGEKTEEATKKFQKDHGLVNDGIVGPVTWGNIGFLDREKPAKIKSESALLKWIHKNLGAVINEAVKDTEYTEDLLGAMAARETGFLIVKYVNMGYNLDRIGPLMKGDYSGGKYNGYGFWQIDLRSYPAFIESGEWQDPLKECKKAIEVLEEKRASILKHLPELENTGPNLEQIIVAAYNTGEGNVIKSIEEGKPIDSTTYNHNYSSEVFRLRNKYKEVSI